MPRDFNDIIPPSRRKQMQESGALPPSPAPAPAPAPRPIEMSQTPASMDDMAPIRPSAPVRPVEVVQDHTDIPVMPEKPLKTEYKPLRTKRSIPIGTILIALVVIAGCVGVLYSFSGAKVVVTPVEAPATVSADITAYKDTGDLTFQQIHVEKIATTDVKSEGTENASESAKGTIVVHNGQANAQPLIKNTRFQTPDGLIFRIRDSIVVPAGGDVTTQVYADEPGDKYNVAATTFTIPGLKGSKAYDLVTAKSSDAMKGGFVGVRASVSQDTRDKSYASLQAELTTSLQKDLASKVPEGYVLIAGGSFPTFEPDADQVKDQNNVTLAEKGSITAVIFPEESLARAVAFKSIGTYDGSPVGFDSVDGLSLKPTDPTLAPDASQFMFSIAGNTNIVWKIDPKKIAGAVAGKSRESAEIALKSFLEVDKATLVLRPFWANTFPTDPDKINVTVSTAANSK